MKSATLVILVAAFGLTACAGHADDQAAINAELQRMHAEEAHRGNLDDGIPKPGSDLGPVPSTAMGQANRAELERARSALMASALTPNSIVAIAEKTVAAQMRDPESVHFQNVVVRYAYGKPYVCGQFNAKNGFGAYVGYEGFLFAGPTAIILNNDKSSSYYTDLALANYSLADTQIARDAAIQYFCGG
jgi:hypothetical protein